MEWRVETPGPGNQMRRTVAVSVGPQLDLVFAQDWILGGTAIVTAIRGPLAVCVIAVDCGLHAGIQLCR